MRLTVERIANVQIKKLSEGLHLATSGEIPGLFAQGSTITETLEIARDVAKNLMGARAERYLKSVR